MAAYAALVSVMHIIDDLEHHPNPPISLHKNQVYLLTQKITFLQEFLEGYNPNLDYSAEADPLETRITDAAYAAEDAIESYIVYQALENVIEEEAMEIKLESPYSSTSSSSTDFFTGKLTFLQECLESFVVDQGYSIEADPLDHDEAEDVIETHIVEITSNAALFEALEKVIQEMALIEKEATEIKQTTVVPPDSSMSSSSSSSSSTAHKSSITMVGAGDALLQMKDKLTSHRRNLQIIPIVGMGGTGKTTLAINIYQDRLIKEYFDICTWATISQEYSIREILAEVLSHLNSEKVGEGLSEHELGEMLYKHLCGKRYLIIMDDIWTIEAWDGVRSFFPDNKNGSRIVVTTRLSNLASEISNSDNLEMKLLDEDKSWELLSKTVFGENDCPVELEEIGKKIGKNCEGLPLSIVVVGGLLAKSRHTIEFWEHIEKNTSTIVNSEDDERCLRILHMSYKHLPIYLKPCFLYMGIYHEDAVIYISWLTMLWIAEGFIKPIIGKSLEEVARMYLKDLTDRNLVLIHKVGITGNIKGCKIHDLLRNLSLREAKKERFYTVVAGQSKTTPQGIVSGQRRVVISSTTSKNVAVNVVSSASLVRSLKWRLEDLELPSLDRSRFLRVLDTWRRPTNEDAKFERSLHLLVNLRLLIFTAPVSLKFKFPCSSWPFLQTLIVRIGDSYDGISTQINIWCMPQIRHVRIPKLVLRDPPSDKDDVVLGNLQTLRRIMNFNFSEQVVDKIPNIKKLNIAYQERVDDDRYGLTNLGYLHKLESLRCSFYGKTTNGSLHSRINFPHILKRLSLSISPSECWEDILDKIGVLPLLRKLELGGGSFKEGHWETTEGHFCSLKFLAIRWCEGLQVWKTESSHFPCLERLCLEQVRKLEEIPLEFADISTLRVLDVEWCSDSAVESAKRIVEEQEEIYGEEAALQVQVRLYEKNEALMSLASPNFRVTR